MKKIIFLLFSFFALLPAFSQQKLRLDALMIRDELYPSPTGSNPITNLIDEQGCNLVNGSMSCSSAPQSQWKPSYNDPDYPTKTVAILDLRQAFALTHLAFYYSNGYNSSYPQREIKVYSGTPGNWTQVTLTTAPTSAGWQTTAVNLSTRYLRIELNYQNRIPNELMLYTSTTNQAPVSNAGSNQTLTLPASSINLTGTGTDADGSIVAYQWTKKSGPSATLTNSNSATVQLSNLQPGIYTMGLTVTDNQGFVGYSETKLTVSLPSGATSSQIPLTLATVTNESGRGDATKMIDQQSASSPAAGNNRWWAGYNDNNPPSSTAYAVPASAYIDLGKQYRINNIRIFDGGGSKNLIVEYGSPGNWQPLFTDPLSLYNQWHDNSVDITTRYVRFTQTGDAEFNEVVFYGYEVLQCGSQGPYPVVLTNFLNSYQDATGNLIKASTGSSAFASSINRLAPQTDGSIEWTVGNTVSTDKYVVSLSQDISNTFFSLACQNGVFRACPYGIFSTPFQTAGGTTIEFTPAATDKMQIKRQGTNLIFSRLSSSGTVLSTFTLNPAQTLLLGGMYSIADEQMAVLLTINQGNVPAIAASFCQYLSIVRLADNLPCSSQNSTGNLRLSMQGGKEPFSYQWSYKPNLTATTWTSEAASTLSRTDLPYGNTYKVVITENGNTASKTYSYGIGSQLQWINQYNTRFNADGSLERLEAYDYTKESLAYSDNMLDVQKDGWMEWRVGDLNNNIYKIGFSYSFGTDMTPAFSMGIGPFGSNLLTFTYNSGSFFYGSIFSDKITNGTLMAMVNGTATNVSGYDVAIPVLPDDVLRIARVGNKIKFYKNGEPITVTLNLVNGGNTTRAIEFDCYGAFRMVATTSIGSGKIPSVTASFCKPFMPLSVSRTAETVQISGNNTDVLGGSTTIGATGGIAPYSYKWLADNNSQQSRSGLSYKDATHTGSYQVEMKDATGSTLTRRYGVGFLTQWASTSGATVWQDGSISKNDNTATGMLVSANAISGDGWAEFVVGSQNEYKNYKVSLTWADDATQYTLGYGVWIDFYNNRMQVQTTGVVAPSCSGGEFSSASPCSYALMPEDIIRIERVGNQVQISLNRPLSGQNSIVALYSTTITPPSNPQMKVVVQVSQGRVPAILCSHPSSGSTVTPALGSQPNDVNANYVVENTILTPIDAESQISSLTVNDMSQKISYFDGLGRPIQSVVSMGSPSKKDLVQVMVYDEFGRETKKYLPYTASPVLPNGSKLHAFDATSYSSTEQYKFYQGQPDVAHDISPYAESLLEASPLNRILEQGAVGQEWQITDRVNGANNNTVKMLQRTNTANEVRLWNYDFATETAISSANFNAGELMVSEVTDEHGLKTRSYTDKEGQVICKKVQKVKADENSFISTYYIYDNFGLLRFVLPPEAVNRLFTGSVTVDYTSDFTRQWLFTHKYDYRQRVIEKQVPGGGKTVMVYDRADRLVMSQDEKQRARNEWTFTKYDALSRPIMTGLYTATGTREDMQTAVNAQIGNLFEERHNTNFTTNHGYTVSTFPNGSVSGSTLKIHSVSYYDEYSYDGSLLYYDLDMNGSRNSYEPFYSNPTPDRSTPAFETSAFRTNGKPIATKILVMDGQSTPQYLLSSTFYDKEGRVIQNKSENYMGGTDIASSRYDFAGRVLETKLQNGISGNASKVVMFTQNSYDHASRIVKTEFVTDPSGTVIPSWRTLTTYAYNETGQLTSKQLGKDVNGATLQKVDFAYNIRSWLRKINDANLSESGDIFGLELMYNKLDASGGEIASPNYNGNISKISWKSSTDEVFRSYEYKYDGMNRLLEGRYSSSKAGENFTLSSMSYDDNGNILSLKRNNLITRGTGNQSSPVFGLVDDLIYNYAGMGNRLKAVSDVSDYRTASDALASDFSKKVSYTGAAEYDYDLSGSLQRDENKGITSIVYNYLNLPEQIIFDSGDKIVNVYDAAGIKLEKRVYQGAYVTSSYYLAGMVYEGTSLSTASLQFVPTGEGRLVPKSSGGYSEEYFIKDHLGNLRISFKEGVKTTYTATMETSNADAENAQWLNITSTRTTYSCPAPNQSGAKLTSSNRFGPWRELKIGKGDELRFSSRAYYTSSAAAFSTVDLLNLVQAGASAVTILGNANNNAEKLKVSLAFVPRINLQNNQLKAYLQYIVYDKNYNYVTSGRSMVTTDALNNCNSVLNLSYKATSDGYVQIMVVNEGDRDVFFDDVSIEHKTALITQENHYDPWGLTLADIEKVGQPEHDFKYNGKELIDDLDLGWNDYGWRNYDPSIGRWNVIDALSEKMRGYSPYNYNFDNPIIFIDPLGKKPLPVINNPFNPGPSLTGWEKLTADKFRHFAYRAGLGTLGKGLPFESAIGGVFERAVGEAFNYKRNGKNFDTESRQHHAGVKPDFVQATAGVIQNSDGSTQTVTFKEGHFIEAKAVYIVSMDGSGDRQIKAMIDVLADMKSDDGTVDASTIRATALTLVTPADSDISSAIIDHATKKGVRLYHMETYYSTADRTKVKYTYPNWLNPKGFLESLYNMMQQIQHANELSSQTGVLRWANVTPSQNDPPE